MPIYALLYRSRARPGLPASAVTDLLEAAARNNPAQGITGLLVHTDLSAVAGGAGVFTQWIEGPRAAVEALFARIAADERHTSVEVLARGPAQALTGADARLFPAWTMALEALDGVPQSVRAFVRYARRQEAARGAAARGAVAR